MHMSVCEAVQSNLTGPVLVSEWSVGDVALYAF